MQDDARKIAGMPTREEVARAICRAARQPEDIGWRIYTPHADAILALLQPDDAMVERGAKALCGYGWEHSMTEEARQEYRDNARACLTAALKQGTSG